MGRPSIPPGTVNRSRNPAKLGNADDLLQSAKLLGRLAKSALSPHFSICKNVLVYSFGETRELNQFQHLPHFSIQTHINRS